MSTISSTFSVRVICWLPWNWPHLVGW